jgi:two-component system, LytTR family, sensor kinase
LGFQNSLHTFFSDCEKSIGKHKLYHVLFWLLYASLTASVIRIGNTWLDSFQRQLPIVTTHALVVYVNLYVLLPKLLLVRNYFTYIISVLLLIVGATFPLAILTHRLVAQEVIQDEVWSSFFLFLIAVGLFFSLILSMTLKFLKEWYEDQQSKRELRQVQLQTELMYLKSQINPHFLFNSLNNLYALTLMKSDLAPQIVLRLSDILRYVLYESSAGKVDIQKEIQHLHDFIQLEKLRLGERVTVQLDLAEPHEDFKIEHIKGTSTADGYALFVENSVSKISVDKTAGGIGLSNLRKRLDLIYHGKYQLNITQDTDKYSVSLVLTLSHG